jgi:uncharacterized protein (DUF697 family)
MDGVDDSSRDSENHDSRLLKLITAVAISPNNAKALVESYRLRSERQHPHESPNDRRRRISRGIVKRYARLAAISATALPGAVPGFGTALAMLGGGTADTGICIKLQVDMCMCLAECYGHDLTSEDARHLSMLLALFGTLEGLGEAASVKLGTKAGVTMLQKYLRGAVLQTLKRAFAVIGVRFTRKALEKTIPFGVGVAAGVGLNYSITRYVGDQATQWLSLEGEV